MAAVVLALCAGASWGAGDFLGGLASRRLHVLSVLAVSQVAGLVGVAAWVAVSSDPLPGAGDLLPAAGAGVAGAIGLGALYRGMALGAMGVVAPISAISPIVPLALDVAHGNPPSAVQLAGIGTALAGVALVSWEPGAARLTAVGGGFALLAALGFGFFVVGLDTASDASVPWAVATARAVASACALASALSVRSASWPPRGALPMLCLIGAFDVVANVLVGLATTKGLVSVVAVLSALYPLMTVLLARVALGERLGAQQRVGGATALAGAALVAVG